MLRPYHIPRQQRAELPDRLAGPRSGAAEQGAREEQEMPVAHRPHRAPLAAPRERGGRPRVREHGNPLRIPRDDRLERHLRGWRRNVAEHVPGAGLGSQLIEVAAVADDDRRIVPHDKSEGGGAWWRLVEEEA